MAHVKLSKIILRGLSQKNCHAELVSASILYMVYGFRNKFGMTLELKLIGQPLGFKKWQGYQFLKQTSLLIYNGKKK